MNLIQDRQQVLTSRDISSTIFGFLDSEPLAICNLVCLAWGNDSSEVDSRYFTTSLSLLRYAHENECPWNEYIVLYAALNGQLNCLMYLHDDDCPWDGSACCSAAENGHLLCLIYLHSNGCPWNWWTCTLAARNSHLACLKYAHERGCRWDECKGCGKATLSGHLARHSDTNVSNHAVSRNV